jgi:hypothetical protein
MARFVGTGDKKIVENKEEINVLKQAVDKILVKDCISYKGIDIYPILVEDKVKTTLITLDEALKAQKAEVLETGTIKELIIKNKSENNSILIIEGTIVKGGKQNRVINTTLILDKASECRVPTTCVEQGRWGYNVPNDFFVHSGEDKFEFNNTFIETNYVSPTVYCCLSTSVGNGMAMGGTCEADQGLIWGKVNSFSMSLGSESTTNDYTKVYRDKEKDIKEYHQVFKDGLEGSIFNGLLAVIKGQKIFLNFSCDNEIMDVRLKPFIESVVVESLNLEQKNIENQHKVIVDFLNGLPNININKYKNNSGDYDVRFDNNSIVGSYYLHKNDLIFLSVVKDI